MLREIEVFRDFNLYERAANEMSFFYITSALLS